MKRRSNWVDGIKPPLLQIKPMPAVTNTIVFPAATTAGQCGFHFQWLTKTDCRGDWNPTRQIPQYEKNELLPSLADRTCLRRNHSDCQPCSCRRGRHLRIKRWYDPAVYI